MSSQSSTERWQQPLRLWPGVAIVALQWMARDVEDVRRYLSSR